MLEERALVTSVDTSAIYVDTMRKSTCSGCKASAGCGNALLDNIFQKSNRPLRVLPADGIEEGDEVIIGLQEDALLRGSFAVYSIPLLLMLVFSMLVSFFFDGLSDGWIVLSGLAGLMAGFAWLKLYSAGIRNDARYQPVILRKC